MSTFVDTSAFLAVLNADDENHPSARVEWERLVNSDDNLACTSYVLVETFALVQNRLGLDAVRTFNEAIVPLLQIEWIDSQAHNRGVTALLIAARRRLSLVDCVSFEAMRRLGISTAFTFDQHFREQGFTCIP